MNRETIIKLVQSTDPGDVTIGLNFLRHYRLKEIKTMFPPGSINKRTFGIALNCRHLEEGYYRLQHHLYARVIAGYILLSSTPIIDARYYKPFLL